MFKVKLAVILMAGLFTSASLCSGTGPTDITEHSTSMYFKLKEITTSGSNILMLLTFFYTLVNIKLLKEEQKRDFKIFSSIGLLATSLGFVFHLQLGSGYYNQSLWNSILYSTVIMSYFYTSIAVKIFSDSKSKLRVWHRFCIAKAFLFSIIQYNIGLIKPYFEQVHIVLFLISSLFACCYIFVKWLQNVRNKKFLILGLSVSFYLATVVNRIIGGDINHFLNFNTLMHLGIVAVILSIFKSVKREGKQDGK